MLISLPVSRGGATDDWDALVARETLRQRDIEAAFDRADAFERHCDFRLALAWLDRAGDLSGGLSPVSGAQRARLASQVRRRQPMTGPRSDLAACGRGTCVRSEIESRR